MTLEKITRVVYGLFGVACVVIGAGSMLLPTGWLPQKLTDDVLAEVTANSFVEHLLQEFGTVVLALGFVFLWYANRKEHSRSFHWAMTLYFARRADSLDRT
jgi:ABC-type Fe3+ transport system permease subunit